MPSMKQAVPTRKMWLVLRQRHVMKETLKWKRGIPRLSIVFNLSKYERWEPIFHTADVMFKEVVESRLQR